MKPGQNKYLLVKGCAGIGNRLFTLASAIQYAIKTKRILVVDWCDGVFSSPDENSFPMYFQLQNIDSMSLEKFSEKSTGLSYYPASLKENIHKSLYSLFVACHSNYLQKITPLRKLNGRMSRLCSFWMYKPGNNFGITEYSDVKAIKGLFSHNDVEYGHKLGTDIKKDVVLFADYWPSNIPDAIFEHIVFTPGLLELVKKKQSEFGINENVMGVHIRFTDKTPGKELDQLKKRLHSDIENKALKIFLCTDNQEIEKQFQSEFSGHIILNNKFFPNTAKGENMHHWSLKKNDYSYSKIIYEESLVDLCLLAACGKIYYQGNSSFSKLAVIINKKKSKTINWLKSNEL